MPHHELGECIASRQRWHGCAVQLRFDKTSVEGPSPKHGSIPCGQGEGAAVGGIQGVDWEDNCRRLIALDEVRERMVAADSSRCDGDGNPSQDDGEPDPRDDNDG